MKNEFVPYEQALALKELGFDEPCFVVWPGIEGQKLGYDGKYFSLVKGYKNSKLSKEVKRYAPGIIDVAAPTFSQVFRWFREKYSLNHEISYAGKSGQYHAFVKSYVYGNNGNNPSVFTYEEAELACLDKLIEICKEKKS